MSEFKEGLQKARDKFRYVIEYVGCYTSGTHFDQISQEARAFAKENKADAHMQAEIELALLRVQRFRTNLSTSEAAVTLKRISKSASGNELLRSKIDIVDAQVDVFCKANMLSARAKYAALVHRLKRSEETFLYGLVANGYATALMTLGEDEEAEAYFQDAISSFRKIESEIQYAYSLNNYGVLKKKICQYFESERWIRKALRIFQKLGVADGEALCYNNLGVIRYKIGDWSNAEHFYYEAAKRKKALSDGHMETASENFRNCLLSTETNKQHLVLKQRKFTSCREGLENLYETAQRVGHWRTQALAKEFLGELKTEQRDFEAAELLLGDARATVLETAPESDVMTEIMRRQAQLHLLQTKLDEARREALSCIRLCRKTSDKHEMGAALRILGEVYAGEGLEQKAAATFEAGINILKSIGECYELMRTCVAYSEFLIDTEKPDADIYLLEAKQLCRKLEIDFFMSKILLLQSRYEHNRSDFMAARSYLKQAEELCEEFQECDRKQMRPQIKHFYKILEHSILQTSIKSAERLKSLGKIYEDARFPIEEIKPELATKVARNVGAESLFLAEKAHRGFRIPLKYNLAVNDAKHILSRQLRGDAKELFKGPDPKIRDLSTGKTLVCVPGPTNSGTVLCVVVGPDQSFTPAQLEFLFASVGALEKLAEEYGTDPMNLDVSDFMDEGDGKLSHPGGHFKDIITLDSEMIKVIRLAERASTSNLPILLEGETGVGKDLFARAIHSASPRKDGPFVTINAGGMPVGLLESQLFGHVRGAFTDAVTDRSGLVEEARHGSLFLDEIGEMGEELQVKLLRLLDNGEYRRLGENRVRTADVRVVSATNKDLEQQVKKAQFREDLYYRLAMVKFRIPPLRDRKRDIEFLVRHFLNEGMAQIGRPRRRMNVDVKALEAFEFYQWPGNIRELRNELLRILSLIGEGEVIRFGMLSQRIIDAFKSQDDGGILAQRVDRFERRLILKALEENDWNRIKTAEQIGIPRTTLLFKMKRLNIVA